MGIWPYPSKKAFLARLRDYFEVGENAFTLLNRAAGLKQLNSIDEIFRELVLDDRSAFERAAEVASSFDDLTDIHRELETARKQQRSLQPVADGWERYRALQEQLQDKQALEGILPVWFAEQGIVCGWLKPTGLRRSTNRPNWIRRNAGVSLRSRRAWSINIVSATCE
ncbi:hypothetical protein P4200_04980 [Pseudomonas aeruginosa]|nr:hypothetical protein [Pseudomonas aeruginosa]